MFLDPPRVWSPRPVAEIAHLQQRLPILNGLRRRHFLAERKQEWKTVIKPAQTSYFVTSKPHLNHKLRRRPLMILGVAPTGSSRPFVC
jgi:hypothetical protein